MTRPTTQPTTEAAGAERTPSKTHRVADTLRAEITAGVLPAGRFLPSEAEIQARFGISRGTARNAVDLLNAWGLVATTHGKGTIVRRLSDRPAHTHTRAPAHRSDTGAGDNTEAGGGWHALEEPGTYRTQASADVALTLALPEGAPVFVHDRLLADPTGQRLFHRLYVPFALCADTPALEQNPFRTPPQLYAILREAGHTLQWIEHVRARIPSPDDTTSLNIPPTTPMLQTWRVTHTSPTGRPLTLEETRLSAEDTQLAYPLTEQPAPPAPTTPHPH